MARNVTWLMGLLALILGLTAVPHSGAAPPEPGSECGSSAPSLVPDTPDEQTLVRYFDALDQRDYPTAWNFFGGEVQSMYGSQQGFADLMTQHVSCVRLLGVKPFGAHTYLVHLAAQYVAPFPAGSGELPGFWTVDDGTIIEFGTGPPA